MNEILKHCDIPTVLIPAAVLVNETRSYNNMV